MSTLDFYCYCLVNDQFDQIGRFLKVLNNKFAHKISPKSLVTFWTILKGSTLWKNCCGIFLGNFWKHLDYISTSISGHTVNYEIPRVWTFETISNQSKGIPCHSFINVSNCINKIICLPSRNETSETQNYCQI